ncbi:uncharacterized protein LOC133500487 isoform X2 [Syngnathoides biaculeatus]|uniref:uncharacterized protein LOC133500487 isoform X2 n=1 Tax=Syngnathoides biaculeatus TaxID=300417 RepID=UPI002ADE1B75|nr:uncharacterized protein LOC133500487 isoform X2 [Syngnathoides biaculeatus]
MGHTCVVWGCTNRAQPGHAKRKYFDIPKVIVNQGSQTERLSTERRNLWLSRINRAGFTPDPAKRHYKVCSDHFVTGCKANLYEVTHPDWAPSLKMAPERQSLPDTTPKSQPGKKRHDRPRDREGRPSPDPVRPDFRVRVPERARTGRRFARAPKLARSRPGAAPSGFSWNSFGDAVDVRHDMVDFLLTCPEEAWLASTVEQDHAYASHAALSCEEEESQRRGVGEEEEEPGLIGVKEEEEDCSISREDIIEVQVKSEDEADWPRHEEPRDDMTENDSVWGPESRCSDSLGGAKHADCDAISETSDPEPHWGKTLRVLHLQETLQADAGPRQTRRRLRAGRFQSLPDPTRKNQSCTI